jgi:anthranilate synthase/aminodeoxychorismate synthase-like glutamine amidotransferase
MILVIDNYDSFTYNLVQYLGELGVEVMVRRNDKIRPEDVEELKPQALVISPGPCTPTESGVSLKLITRYGAYLPILGVCLGHQCIGQVFGGQVIRAPHVMHGKTSHIHHNNTGLFTGLENPFTATRYHSLLVDRESLPACLHVTAWTDDGLIMGLQHESFPIHGVQFHPESILTRAGHDILANFLRMAGLQPRQVVSPKPERI